MVQIFMFLIDIVIHVLLNLIQKEYSMPKEENQFIIPDSLLLIESLQGTVTNKDVVDGICLSSDDIVFDPERFLFDDKIIIYKQFLHSEENIIVV